MEHSREPALTRRALLGAGAASAAGLLLAPGSALGALAGPPRPRISERYVGFVGPAPRELPLAPGDDLLGVQWNGPHACAPQLRFRSAGGRLGPWVSAGAHGHAPEAARPPGDGRVIGDPVWSSGAVAVQLRAPVALRDVRLHVVDVSAGGGAARAAAGPLARAAALPLAAPQLAAGAGQPPIIARRAWAQGVSHPRVTPEYGAVRMAFVHHTENPSGYSPNAVPAMLRAIYAFHRFVRGWNDIGYNFVIDRYGRVFEARAGGIDEPVVGAHAGGYNLESTGIAILGTFMSTPISAATRRSLQRLLAWKLSLHGVPASGRVTVRVNPAGAIYSRFPANAHVSLPHIAGHRDGDTTDCPGDVLYGELPAIRRAVGGLAPRPVLSTLALIPAPAPQPQPAPGSTTSEQPPGTTPEAPPPAPPTLAGTLAFLDGSPVAAATVLVQARSTSRRGEVVVERTLAQVVTDAQGRWALPASFPGVSGATWLRALFDGTPVAGASVSRPLLASL